MEAEEERAETSRVFRAYGRTLKMVLSFKYLGVVISAADDEWPEVIRNLTKVRVFWRRAVSILARARETAAAAAEVDKDGLE